MFTYSIKKGKPGVVQRLWNFGRPPIQQMGRHPAMSDLEHSHQDVPRPGFIARQNSMSEHDRSAAMMYADKTFYANWITSVGYLFKPGDLVTLRGYPYIPMRKTPPFFFIVDTLQEIRHLAEWDTVACEPKAVGLRPGDNKDAVYRFASPKGIRHLHTEEVKLVHLQHPEIKGRIAIAQRLPSADIEEHGRQGSEGDSS